MKKNKNRGIEHDPFINIHKVQREVLKTEGFAKTEGCPRI